MVRIGYPLYYLSSRLIRSVAANRILLLSAALLNVAAMLAVSFTPAPAIIISFAITTHLTAGYVGGAVYYFVAIRLKGSDKVGLSLPKRMPQSPSPKTGTPQTAPGVKKYILSALVAMALISLMHGIVAAQIGKCIQYDGTMDGALFEMWFEQLLLPTLPRNTVIVMDNASFHRKSRLTSIAERAGHTLLFLPPYSPELNPIENFWAWLKRYLRKILPDALSFDDALYECFQVRRL